MRIEETQVSFDLKTQKLVVSVALLALELQTKIKQVYMSKQRF